MSYFVIMNVGTEQLYRKPGEYSSAVYDTQRGAKGACTKINKQYGGTNQWVVMTHDQFEFYHNPLVEVTNILSGKKCMIRRSDKGGCCDPSTERFFTM
jgi:hypothetical protein